MAEQNRFWAVYRRGVETLYLGSIGWSKHIDKAVQFTYVEALAACRDAYLAPGATYSVEPVLKAVAHG